MSDWKLPWNASCLCERVKMRISAPPLLTVACHCKGCQKLTSGPYSLTTIVPASGFEVRGETPVIGALHGPHRHYYCERCKSWLYTIPHGFEEYVNFRPSMLDDATWVVPLVDVVTREKLPGVVSGAKYSFEYNPEPAEFPRYIEAFAREGARPP